MTHVCLLIHPPVSLFTTFLKKSYANILAKLETNHISSLVMVQEHLSCLSSALLVDVVGVSVVFFSSSSIFHFSYLA